MLTRGISHRAVLRGAAATWAAAFGLLWAAALLPHAARAGVLVAAITIFTLAEILQGPVINALVVELAPATHPGPYLSIYQMSWSIGQAIAPAVLLGLLAAGPSWLWATTVGLCLIIILGTGRFVSAPSATTGNR